MSLQNERIQTVCEQLELNGILSCYSHMAQNAASTQQTYTDFLEKVLDEELSIRKLKARQMLLKTSGLPYVKTLEQFDLSYNPGMPTSAIRELFSLSFVERKENVVLFIHWKI